MLSELQGQLERITYFNEANHYTIARLKVQGQKRLVTIVGNLLPVSLGEILKLKGSWDVHPKYGEQFKFVSCETVVPATAKGIERYLGSGLIKGIGPVMARRLVDKFGVDTLTIIEKEPEKLREVEGFGTARIQMIRTAWEMQKDVREVMIFLQNYEISAAYAAKIYRQYGKDSVSLVRENPYRLAADIFGIGFQTADRIAGKLGIPADSIIRAEAGILYVLQKLSEDGHVLYPFDPLVSECGKILDMKREIILQALEKVAAEKKVIIDNGSVYLGEFYAAEVCIAGRLKAIGSSPKDRIPLDRESAVAWVQNELNIVLETNQARAVEESIERKLMVITGGPGTGKTTIIRAIIRISRRAGLNVMLAAPTGRAAKRMSEAAGYEAKTIHRLLEFSPKNGGFRRNENERLVADLIIIDEASMVDTVLMHHLLKAVPDSTSMIFVGDVDQLPSVGAGNVLRDIIESGFVPTVRLNEIFRQSGESMIIVNAHRINRGEFPVITSDRDSVQDFYFVELEEPERVADMIIKMCKEKIPAKFGFDPLDDIQVLTPMHRGVIGASNLNAEMQKHLNPSVVELHRGGRVFKTGDKVMQIRNNYDLEVYNGDIGRVAGINTEDQELAVNYDGRLVLYDFADLDELVLAYAVSVHKSQGSEYPAVVMPLLTQHYLLLQRNLLYTAITRGKKLVVIIGTKKALGIAIRNSKTAERYTALRERLQA